MLYWPAFSLNYASDGVIMWKDEDFRKIKKDRKGFFVKERELQGIVIRERRRYLYG